MEAYLREKKEAILEDRRLAENGNKLSGNANEMNHMDDDQKSCLQQVQEKYQTLRDEANEDAKSRRSHISKTASAMARSGAPQSLVGSAALLKQRLEQDFGVKLSGADPDKVSVISGLDDEIDEWAALNKYAVLRSF